MPADASIDPSFPPVEPDPFALEAFEELAARRRTTLRLDREREVPIDLAERLCQLATWAPNHKRTWPWRFALLVGGARARLGDLTAEQLVAEGVTDDAKLAKARTKYLRAPMMLAVGAAPHPDPELHGENRDAVAAAVQTLLLGATAVGLGSFWASGAPLRSAAVRELCGFEPDDRIVALVYLGWPAGEVPVPERPPAPVVVVDR
ncbi:MAG TPA: nitroreductase [Acidimicrobiales bacterium]|nr:nitroreductase [Acidimicrobiales bacterium]